MVEVLSEWSTEVQEVQTIVEEEGDNWMTPIIKYLEEGIVASDNNKARALRAKIGQYTMESGVLLKKGAVVRKAMRQGYYWPTMHADAKAEGGMDILGPLTPARGGAKFVVVAIDYFTKWVEAKPNGSSSAG
ncbi:reverse transcriptase domain-containing protein [Tanacetum coccineum]